MFGAAAALDAGVSLQGDDLGDVAARSEAEVFHLLVGGQRRNGGEAVALEQDCEWREDEVEVLGVGDQGKEEDQRQGVGPPEGFEGGFVVDEEGGEVGGHQGEDEQGNEAGFVGDLTEPDGASYKSAHEKPSYRNRDKQRPRRGEGEVEAADEARGRKEGEAQACGEVVERDQGEGQESPEDEGVSDARQWTLADDFGLAENLPDEDADSPGDGAKREAEVFTRTENGANDGRQAEEEQ